MDGIICIDKPQDFTSFDVVAKMRGILGTRKIGHSGTLDPMATGVLVLFAGKATKAIDLIENHDKRYIAGLRLGITTDTQDITGSIINKATVNVTSEELLRELYRFKGETEQLPPMFSAVQVNGKRLYELARKGVEVERKPRSITVYDINVTGGAGDTYTLDIFCSKGTYVRTICHDLGQRLGCGGTLAALRRISAHGFEISECRTIEEMERLKDAGELHKAVIPVDRALENYSPLNLDNTAIRKLKNGQKLELGLNSGKYKVYGGDSEFFCAAVSSDGFLKAFKWFGSE